MKVKAPILIIADAIRALRVNLPAERRRRDRLRLAAREQRAAVRAREKTTFRGDWTDRVNVAPVLSTPVPTNHVANGARLDAAARETNIRRLRGLKRGHSVSRRERKRRAPRETREQRERIDPRRDGRE